MCLKLSVVIFGLLEQLALKWLHGLIEFVLPLFQLVLLVGRHTFVAGMMRI